MYYKHILVTHTFKKALPQKFLRSTHRLQRGAQPHPGPSAPRVFVCIMAAKDAKTAAEADLLNSKEEVSPLTEEELAIISSAKAKLTEQQLSVCTEVDDRAICRGFREEGIDAIEEAFIRIMNVSSFSAVWVNCALGNEDIFFLLFPHPKMKRRTLQIF